MKKNISKRLKWFNNINKNCVNEEFYIHIASLENKKIKGIYKFSKKYKLYFKLNPLDYESLHDINFEISNLNLINDLVGTIGKLLYEQHIKYLKKANIFNNYYRIKSNTFKETSKNESCYDFFKIERFIDKLLRNSTEKNCELNRECHYIFTFDSINLESVIFDISEDKLYFYNDKNEKKKYKTRISKKIEYIKQYYNEDTFSGQFNPIPFQDLFKGIY